MPIEKDELLAVALRDYEERSSAGVPPSLLEYRARLGDAWDDFVQIVDTEAELKALLEPAPAPPLGGLFGGYELLRLIGRGATGLVYEARNTTNNRTEAVKILRPGLETEPDSLTRFRREVQVAQELEHPNIVHVFSCGEIGGYPYCAMELVEGMSLRQAVSEGKLPALPELCRGFAGIADALQMLHEHGILHRDVKPSNIVLRPDGTMVLADFGLARAADLQRITWTGQMLGTPRYMSPEQLRGHELDPRADVYGLGASLYRVLSGRPLFEADTVAELALKILRERPVPLERIAPGVPADLGGIVMKAVETEVRDRQASAGELRDELRAFAEGGTTHSRPVSPLRRLGRRARRCWLPLSAVAALLVAGVVLYLRRDAHLDLTVLPNADVTLGDETWRTAGDLTVSAAPGDWRVRLQRRGFQPVEIPIALSAGDREEATRVLVVADPNDQEAAAALQEALHARAVVKYDDWTRGGPDEIVPVFPRRRVRFEDLGSYRVELNALLAIEEEGGKAELVFRYEGGKVLSREPFDPATLSVEEPLPRAVRSALKLGDEIRWGIVAGSAQWTTTFTVAEIPKRSAGRWALVAGLAKDQHPGIRAWLRGSFLLSEGFALAALREMQGLAEGSETFPPWVVAREAVMRMHIPNTNLDEEVEKRIRAFPQAIQDAWAKGPR